MSSKASFSLVNCSLCPGAPPHWGCPPLSASGECLGLGHAQVSHALSALHPTAHAGAQSQPLTATCAAHATCWAPSQRLPLTLPHPPVSIHCAHVAHEQSEAGRCETPRPKSHSCKAVECGFELRWSEPRGNNQCCEFGASTTT